MKYLTAIPKTARRITTVIAAASAAGLIAASVAFAAGSSGALLAPGTARPPAAGPGRPATPRGRRRPPYAASSVEPCSHPGPVSRDATPLQAGGGPRNG